MENVKLDLEILRSQVDSLQSLAISQETCPPNNNDVIRLQIELCDEKIKNKKLESEFCLLANKRISEIDKLTNRLVSLEAKLENSFKNPINMENSREGNLSEISFVSSNSMKVCQPNLHVYEHSAINYPGNQQSLSSSKIAYDKESLNRNNIKSSKKVKCITPESKATFIEISKSTITTNARQKSLVQSDLPGKKVKEKSHLNPPPQIRPLPQIPEWLSCLHLIETPKLIDWEIDEDISNKSHVIKTNAINHNKFDMRQTISTEPPQNRPYRFQSYQSSFPKRQRIKHPYRHFHRFRSKEWLNYLDFVHQVMRNN